MSWTKRMTELPRRLSETPKCRLTRIQGSLGKPYVTVSVGEVGFP